ncbi:hypothetical protein NDK43_19830 [Neobacillus pocheonensis]|uniref:Tetratricopeptide repeat protein n=1 Tax=Neobacillus pocheonensis TaxID=363869 RepID=A0ABT0WCZ5_9BACI|nr:hypothetical protein [Neobacillus pocheonensis]
MYKGLIIPTEISIKGKKNMVKGTISRAAIFARTNVIEVLTVDNERFYLIYYRNSLIYGDKLSKVEEGSFITKAFHEGIVIESPHPLLKSFIPNQSVSIPNKSKLFSQLQLHYSLEEIAYIATTLDSFFEKDELVKIIDKVYFHYRRSGSFIKSFQVVRMLSDFDPTLKSASERLNSQEFNSYHNFYKSSSLASIQKKDPLFVELHCFLNRTYPDEQLFLGDLFRKQDCLAPLLLLWLEKVRETNKAESIEQYTAIALKVITMKEWIFILGEVNINPYRELPETLSIVEKMIQEGDFETAALYLLNFIHDLPTSYDSILNILWANLNAGFVGSHLDQFIFMFQQLSTEDYSQQSEQKVFQLAVILLEEHSLKAVLKKLLPIQKLLPHSVVIPKMKKMVKLLEDPDRMMELGDFYAEFKQFDKAIDCFFWEMELKPQDPSPVQKISKMYQHKGMVNEATTYQKVYAQLKSNQGVG